MDENIENNVSVLTMLDTPCASASVYKTSLMNTNYHSSNHTHITHSHVTNLNPVETENGESSKQSILWTKTSTVTLLSLYETKMNTLHNPKKKSKMWISIAEELKAMGIEVTPDQVRWKVNALTKKYKDCIDDGQGAMGFKYFNEMHQILGQYSDTCDSYRLASGVESPKNLDKTSNRRLLSLQKKAPFRRLRAERRAKVELDRLWAEYIQKQDAQRHIRDERFERSLRLREEELQLKKKELEIKQTLALKKLQLKERKQEEILKIEKEKCALLRKLLENQ